MSSTASTSASNAPTSISQSLASGGSAQRNGGISIGSFVASLAAGLVVFGIELGVFILIHGRFSRIYQPRTFLVPERERTKAPPKGLWQWLQPVFRTTNSDFIQKCGLDAYFFLRYLRTLLKIFIPLSLLLLPILIPVNAVGGRGPHFVQAQYDFNNTYQDVNGLDQLAWGNVRPTKNNRYWTHLILGICVIIYTCFVFFEELRNYIRLRQAYLTSPQHRLRASATTVLVTAIPTKWCTFEALDGLYDVFPGGIRNIWVNRNFDELSDKVKWRNRLAASLESAETSLIKNAKKAHLKMMKADAKKDGKRSKKELTDDLRAADKRGLAMAQTDGVSSGNPHQVRHTLDEALNGSSGQPMENQDQRTIGPIPLVGQGLEAVGHGIDNLGKTVFGGLRKLGKDVDNRLDTSGGFVPPTPERTQYSDRGRHRLQDLPYSQKPARSSSVSPEPGDHQATRIAPSHPDFRPGRRDVSDESTVRQSTSQDHDPQRRRSFSCQEEGLAIDGLPADANNDTGHGHSIITNPERLGEVGNEKSPKLKFLHRKHHVPFGIPSPTPHGQEEDEFPLNHPSPMTPGCNPQAIINGQDPPKARSVTKEKRAQQIKKKEEKIEHEYASAVEDYDPHEGEPRWKKYLKTSDRETLRLPIFEWHWMPSLPLIGKKVDAIDYCRTEVARLNLEIEEDQKHPEKFPLMNSAFVQFNNQVAAHMACQAVSHHTPSQMAPRVVEISPDDVIWDNMSIRWWETYIRTGLAITLIVAIVLLWAIPVTFTGLLSNISYLENVSWLRWVSRIPRWLLSIIQGVLPQALLALLLILLPMMLRLIAKTQGGYTGMAVELSVQSYYFGFLFIQVFLVVSISSGITSILPQLYRSPASIPALLAQNLPKASNYFFSYMILQALSVSAGALVQIGGLLQWFVFAPLLDSTARQKWKRQIDLPNMQWGTFFPVYTNLACIGEISDQVIIRFHTLCSLISGLIYSVISPLMLVFNIITFSLFWLVYRYNTLYVTKFRFDTGGLLFPKAINQLFTGLYLMELVMIGLFFLVRDVEIVDGHATPGGVPCKVQGIIMIVVLILTILYQYLLNDAFGPLLRYLPITLEDEAVMRDEEFARAQEHRWMMQEDELQGPNFNETPQQQDQSSHAAQADDDIELRKIGNRKQFAMLNAKAVSQQLDNLVPSKPSWADRTRNKYTKSPNPTTFTMSPQTPRQRNHHHHTAHKTGDPESQRVGTDAIGEALFAGINDEIEDLTPDERDKLVQRAFQHEALRARRPVIWIPRDDLGVSDDEIHRTQRYSKHIWISNEHTGLDGKARVIYRRSPPDFSEVDLIEL